MQLPRRVPWSSLAELDVVCSWIYADDADCLSKQRAVNRLSAWKNITLLPHALESTLALLVAILHDDLSRNSPSEHQLPAHSLVLRHGYAAALIRLVNGLVDPLQQRVYARSIAAISAQIGLPLWLVDLRHQATHEELPSLEVLRSGSEEAMTWLLHNYFLPTLSPPQTSSVDSAGKCLTPPTAILKEYKALLKLTVRDASLKTRYKADIAKILRDIERWIGEARVAATSIALDMLSYQSSDEDTRLEQDPRERWALDRLCDELFDRGGLIPVSTKKRETSVDADSLPIELQEIWLPLLDSVASNHQDFPHILVSNAMSTLLYGRQAPVTDDLSVSRKDASYDRCLARWCALLLDRWESKSEANRAHPATDGEEQTSLRRKDIVSTLLISLGSSDTYDVPDRVGSTFLLQLLCKGQPDLSEVSAILLPTLRFTTTSNNKNSLPNETATSVMEDRLAALLALADKEAADAPDVLQPNDIEMTENDSRNIQLPKGWLLIPITSWKPCPIGIFGGI